MPGFTQKVVEANSVSINCAVAGQGPPVLLLHGHPQNLLVWRNCAAKLVNAGYTVVATDLRGYGDSSKPAGGENHENYAKRTMARDQREVMNKLGYSGFSVIGHDRGARVAHRMARDFPDAVSRIVVVDIAPTATMYAKTDMEFARRYFWWFFLIQPAPLPETLIAHDPEYFLEQHIGRQLSGANRDPVCDEVFEDYLRCYKKAETLSAICEDYRAAASIDLIHDAEDADNALKMPLLALWGERGTVGQLYDVLETWQETAVHARGKALPCGHCPMEECPELFAREVLNFLDTRH